MIFDVNRVRRAHEMALRGLTIYAHAMEELGVSIADAAQGVSEAHQASVASASPALASTAQPAAARKCACCGNPFTPRPRAGRRARYCDEHRTLTARRRFEREQPARGNGESRDPMETIRGWNYGPTTP